MIPCFAAETLIIEACGYKIPCKKSRVLVKRNSGHAVFGIESVVERFSTLHISVVDTMASPVEKSIYGTPAFLVSVLYGNGAHTARDVRVVINAGGVDRTRIGGVEVRNIEVADDIPCR